MFRIVGAAKCERKLLVMDQCLRGCQFQKAMNDTFAACQSWGRGRRGLSLCEGSPTSVLLSTAWWHRAENPWSPLTIVLCRTWPQGEVTGVYRSMFSRTLVIPLVVAGLSSETARTMVLDFSAILAAYGIGGTLYKFDKVRSRWIQNYLTYFAHDFSASQ